MWIPRCGSSGLESDFYLHQLSNCFPIDTLLTVLLQTLCIIWGGSWSLPLLFMLLLLNVIGRMLWSRRTGAQAISQTKALKYKTFSPEMVCGQATKGRLVLLELLLVPCSFSVRLGAGFDTIYGGGERESCDPYPWDAFPLGHHRPYALISWFEVMPICRVEPMPLPSPGGNLRVSTLMTVWGQCSSEPLGDSFGVNETNTLCKKI